MSRTALIVRQDVVDQLVTLATDLKANTPEIMQVRATLLKNQKEGRTNKVKTTKDKTPSEDTIEVQTVLKQYELTKLTTEDVKVAKVLQRDYTKGDTTVTKYAAKVVHKIGDKWVSTKVPTETLEGANDMLRSILVDLNDKK